MRTPQRWAAVLILLVLNFAAPAKGQNLFFVPPSYAGSGPTVTADFNGDGKPDLISEDGTVLLGDGEGTFKTGTALSIPGVSTNLIATGDFNGDGKPDVLLASFPSTNLYIFLGNGDGTFQPPVITNMGASLASVVVADLNGDGKSDVVGIVPGTAVLVLLGKGDGTFAPGVTFGVLSNSTNLVTVGDFDGDGKLDIALAANSGTAAPGSVGVLLNKGDGSFKTAIITPGVSDPAGLVAKDFDGDGKLDLAISDSATNQTFIFLGQGNGMFSAASSPLPATGLLAAADLNGDGKPDLVVVGNPFVEVFLNSGDGAFTLNYTYLQGPIFSLPSVAIADFNGDGKLDVAVDNTMLVGNGDGSLQGDAAIALNNSGLGPAVTGDFNGDGHADIAVASANNANDLYILLGDGTGKFSLAHTYTLPLPFDAIGTVDLKGDGKLDLVFVTHDPTTQDWILNVMMGNGEGSFGSPTTSPQGVVGPVTNVAFADFNGDHKPDLAVISDGQLTVFLGNRDGTFASPKSFFAGSGPTSLASADFNNDGIADVAVASSAGIGILLGKGDGTFQPATFPASGPTLVFAAADLNGDGHADLIAGTSIGGNVQILLGNGDGTFNVLPSTGPAIGKFVSVADINGDGKLDLVESTGVRVLLGNGDGTFGNPIAILPPDFHGGGRGTADSFVLIADFNGDHRPDVAVDIGGTTAGLVTLLNIAVPPAPDFQISASSLSPTTVTPGGSASSTVTVTTIGGFNASVTFTCSGLPSGAKCSFTTSSTPNGTTATLTITTTALSTTLLIPSSGFDSARRADRSTPVMLSLLGMTMVGGLYLWRRNQRTRWATVPALAILVCIGLMATSCGGGRTGASGAGGNGTGGGSTITGTPSGTYPIVVSASATSGSTTLTHTTQLTLVVQ